MALANYQAPRTDIQQRGETIFSVRGLSLDDITYMLDAGRMAVIEKAIDRYVELRPQLREGEGVDMMLIGLIKEFPDLFGEIISLAADEEGEYDKARKLPLGVQLAALQEITLLTMEDAGGLKNLFAMLVNVLRGMLSAGAQTQLASLIGESSIGEAAKT